jgi:hypothetical protein
MNTPAVRVLTDLRNALAHGGIAYLDERGRQTDGQAAMLAFVGAVMKVAVSLASTYCVSANAIIGRSWQLGRRGSGKWG